MKILNKFILPFIFTFSMITIVLVQPTYAQQEAAILFAIKSDTGNILSAINQMPTIIDGYVNAIYKMAQSWIASDSSNIIANSQGSFTQLQSIYSNNLTNQINTGKGFTQQYLAASVANANTMQADTYNQDALSYSTVLGNILTTQKSIFDQNYINAKNNQGNSAQNYIKYASGTNFWLPQASPTWKKGPDQARYQNFFYTIAAVQSYTAYILSDLPNQQSTDPINQTLMSNATSSDFFKNIASEQLGPILRQILMYNAQTYVLLNRMVKIQQQQLTSLAMTNTLLIMLGGNLAGPQLYTRAQQAS